MLMSSFYGPEPCLGVREPGDYGVYVKTSSLTLEVPIPYPSNVFIEHVVAEHCATKWNRTEETREGLWQILLNVVCSK